MSTNSNSPDYQNILDPYYSAFKIIHTQRQSLIKAQQDLTWHENQLKQADQLAIQLGVDGTSNLPVTQTASSHKLDRNRVNSALSNARSQLTYIQNLRKKLNQDLAQLRQEANETVKDIEKRLNQISQDVVKADDTIQTLENTIESLKTARLVRILLVVIVGIVTATGTGSLGWTAFLTTAALVVALAGEEQ